MVDYRIASLYVRGSMTPTHIDTVHTTFLALYGSFLWRPSFPYLALERELTIHVASGLPRPVDPEKFAKYVSDRMTDSDRLVIGEIAPVASFTMDVSGVGDAIDAAAEVADPLRRRERRERLRHATEMNRLAEESGVLDNQLKSVDLTLKQIQTIRELVEMDMMSESDGRVAIARLLNTQDRAAEELESDGVRVLGTSVDPARDLPRSDSHNGHD